MVLSARKLHRFDMLLCIDVCVMIKCAHITTGDKKNTLEIAALDSRRLGASYFFPFFSFVPNECGSLFRAHTFLQMD